VEDEAFGGVGAVVWWVAVVVVEVAENYAGRCYV